MLFGKNDDLSSPDSEKEVSQFRREGAVFGVPRSVSKLLQKT